MTLTYHYNSTDAFLSIIKSYTIVSFPKNIPHATLTHLYQLSTENNSYFFEMWAIPPNLEPSTTSVSMQIAIYVIKVLMLN